MSTHTLPIDSLGRISRVNGRGESLMSDRQQAHSNIASIEAHGYKVGQIIEALNVSGGLVADGPQWQNALERVRKGRSAGVAVAYLDRLSRNVRGGLAWVDALGEAGGILISGGRIINIANPHERAAFISELNMAELQLNVYKERSRETMADVRKRGITNRLPYGYMRNEEYAKGPLRDPERDRKALLPDPDQKAHVVMIYQMRADGSRWPAIVEALHALGVRSPKGEPYWAISTLTHLVRNRIYRGEVTMGAGHVTPDAHEALVSESLWRAAQPNGVRVRTGRNVPGVAHGLLTCSGCGRPLQVQRGGHGRTFYGCRRHGGSQGPCPAPVTGDQAKLDAAVDLLVSEIIGQGALEVVSARRDLDALEATWRAAEAEQTHWIEGAAGLPSDAIRKKLQALGESVEQAKAAYHDALHVAGESSADLPTTSASYLERPVAERQRVARGLIRSIILQPFEKGASRRGADPGTRCLVEWNQP